MKRRTLLKTPMLGATFSGASFLGAQSFGAAHATQELPPYQEILRSKNLKNAKVLVVGGGYAGATAAKYLRYFSNYSLNVTLIEPGPQFISCPLSNLVLSGSKQLADITREYRPLAINHGVQILRDKVTQIDPQTRTLQTLSQQNLRYDRLVLCPGVELMMDTVSGLKQARDMDKIVQAWSAPEETVYLRRQLLSMEDGGVFAISVPELPYRCPPGPYERASQVAYYFKHHKPKSKVIILDANQDVTSKGALFKKFWRDNYPNHLEYRAEHKVMEVDIDTNTVKFEIQDDLQAQVLNILPSMRAGAIAVQTGLANINKRWCEVDFLNFESRIAKYVHVLGDSIQAGPYMPKSAHLANAHAKVCAAALIAELSDFQVNPQPWLTNTCFSFVDPHQAIYIASVHQYDSLEKTFKILPNAGGISGAASDREAENAMGWAYNIWADSLG
jgi:sulfide dehydrogenase [flavocytochrome c] flavoprotein chain